MADLDFDDYQLTDEDEEAEENSKGFEIIKEIAKEINKFEDEKDSLYFTAFDEEYQDIRLSPYENILINEYILSTFQKNVNVDVRDFKSPLRDNRASSISKGEVEYILTGIKSKSISKINVMGRIFLIRQGMNISHIINSPEKINIVKEIGELCAAVFPPAAPVAIVMAINGWAALESVLDIQLLYEEEGIAILKSDKEWLSDIDIAKGKISKKHPDFSNSDKKDFEKLYYNDYLRILLFFSGEEGRFKRILYLVEENYKNDSGKDIDLSEYAVSHNIKIHYKVRPLFFEKDIYKDLEMNGGY